MAASDASAGWGLYQTGADCDAAPVLVGTIPAGTVIPARGHYLLVGSAYSLAGYGGAGAAAGDGTLTADIEGGRSVSLFTTADVGAVSSANRLDAVGFVQDASAAPSAPAGARKRKLKVDAAETGGFCELLREGNALPALPGITTQHTFFRKLCDFVGGVGCAAGGSPKDSNDNAAGFLFADTQGTNVAGVGQRLGAPGPENLASPVRRDTSGLGMLLLDGLAASSASPNHSRSFTTDPANNSTFGTLTIRRRVFNSTGAS